MLTPGDQKILLDTIKTGEFIRLNNLKINLDQYSDLKINNLLKGNDNLRYNYRLAEKLANFLLIENNKLKKNLTRLIASELNHYSDDTKKRDKIYGQLNTYLGNLVSFPERKRIIKFLVKFTITSKALQSLVADNSQKYEILSVFKKIGSEVKI